MSLNNIFGIAGSALNAQTNRMNVTSSNLANSSTVAGSEKEAFRASRTVFKTILDDQLSHSKGDSVGGVKVDQLMKDPAPVVKVQQPGHPLADKDGFIYQSNVNEMGEMIDMMAASRSYQNNIEVINTTRQLMMRTIDVIKS